MAKPDDDGKSQLLRDLETALAAELKKLKGTNPETEKPYSLTEKSKVWDRILKLEAIKAKLPDAQYGTGFTDD